jgi:CDP-4-dehydro-6-deoxyglucose reductase, E3
MPRVSVLNSPRSFSAAPAQSLLDAALDASLNLPHSCKGGNCGACRARLLHGEVHYPNGPPLGLSQSEIAEGLVLLCQARALSDVEIETFEIRPADEAVVKRLPCRIERATPLSHDVMQLLLRLPVAEQFVFEAGQYVDIMLPGGRRRSFSIASPPHDSRPLELHVRRVAGGEFTDKLFHADNRSALLTIEGPLGQFVYHAPEVGGAPQGGAPQRRAAQADATRAGASQASAVEAAPTAAPMWLIGGGTGLAPLLSIMRHVIEKGIDRDMTLYWGVRSEQDLYAQTTLEALSHRAAHLRYVPVLSEASTAWTGRTGWVHAAALADCGALESVDVYAAGPPAMIAALRGEYALRGIATDRLFFDSFDYAPDALERQRTSAATKS